MLRSVRAGPLGIMGAAAWEHLSCKVHTGKPRPQQGFAAGGTGFRQYDQLCLHPGICSFAASAQ